MFGRYRTLRELGRGGMGTVVLAQDTVLDVPVALKLVPEVVIKDSEGIGDLKKEVLRGMELTHPNIVRVFSFEQDDKAAVIVMEHVEGETLAQKKAHRPNRCFDCEEILPWVEQLCAALDYAHNEARIAHRDLKPSNLLITAAGRLKVADFGIASSLSDTLSRVSVRIDSAGTPPYMSPQQAMGERPSHLDDIYSLGATIYELLTGKPPFFRGNILAQVMHEEPIPMSERRAEFEVTGCAPIPEAWEKAVAACLSKNPGGRPNGGSAVLAMLKDPGLAVALNRSSAAPETSLQLVPRLEAQIQPAPAQKRMAKVEAKTARIVRPRQPLSLQPLVSACAALITGTGELIAAVLRPVLIFAALIGTIWGAMFLKHKWDEGQAKRDELAKKEAAARSLAQATAAPAATPPPQVIYVHPPPPPTALDRGPYGGRGPGHRPPPHPPR